VYVEGLFTGTADGDGGTTEYRVPFILIYPLSDPAGFGVVDVPNGAFFEYYPSSDACQTDLSDLNLACPSDSFMSPCETRGDFLCQQPGSVPLSQNRYEQQVYRLGRLNTEDFFFEQGYTYLSVLQHKAVTSHFGPEPPDGVRRRLSYGTIERATDAYEIIRDSGRFLKDPSKFTYSGLDAPAPVTHTVAFGFSGTAFALNTFVGTGENLDSEGAPIIDGFFIQVGGDLCKRYTDEVLFDRSRLGGTDVRGESTAPTYREIFPCFAEFGFFAPPTNGAKVFTLQTQTDLLSLFAGATREEFSTDPTDADCASGPSGLGNAACSPDPNYRNYEIAGPAHLPADVLETAWLGTPTQNPADIRPAVRALFFHLKEWVVDDVPPPASPKIDGQLNTDPESPTFLGFTQNLDDDGNGLGGIRLPFMQRYGEGGEPLEAGAPLGTYGPLAFEFLYAAPPVTFPAIFHIIPLVSGSFVPFDDLAERYPDDTYATRVQAAAQMALDEGFILQEDYDRYIAGLGNVPDPDIPDDPEQVAPNYDSTGCGCSAEGTGPGGTVNFALLLLSLFVVGRRRRRTVRER
jgi:MYXO-CTERM domain-containing protein